MLTSKDRGILHSTFVDKESYFIEELVLCVLAVALSVYDSTLIIFVRELQSFYAFPAPQVLNV